MRKTFILLIIIINFHCFSNEVKWFRSNPSAMPVEEIGTFRKDEFEWVLMIEKNDEKETRILYKGEEIYSESSRFFLNGEIIRTVDSEGEIRTVSEYADGLLRKESIIGPGPSEMRVYFYRNRMIDRIEVFSGGELSYQDNYYLDGRGRLIRVKRSFPGEEVITTRYGYIGGELVREWHRSSDREEFFIMEDGRIRQRQNWIDGELDSSESWVVIDGESVLKIVYPGEEKEIYRLFDDQERLVRETIISGAEKKIITYTYDGENLSGKIIRGGGTKERWEYTWRGDSLHTEKVFRNKAPVKKYIYPETGVRWEVIYRDGEVLATVIYNDDLPVRTLFGTEPEEIPVSDSLELESVQ